eukprot:6507256-Ditylum_brightwellii.AAC.1
MFRGFISERAIVVAIWISSLLKPCRMRMFDDEEREGKVSACVVLYDSCSTDRTRRRVGKSCTILTTNI